MVNIFYIVYHFCVDMGEKIKILRRSYCEKYGEQILLTLKREQKNVILRWKRSKGASCSLWTKDEVNFVEKTVKMLTDFDLGQICDSGQCFRMERITEQECDTYDAGPDETGAGYYRVIAGRRYLEVMQQGEKVTFFCGEAEYEDFWKDYFDLEADYGAWKAKINPNDKYLTAAAALGGGIRILRQDLWEMIVSFLISQQNHIARIRRCIRNICEKYGEPMTDFRGETYYAFPRPESLASLEENALMECNLGYRSKYVVRTARSVVSGEVDLEQIREMSYAKAREELLKLFGVGGKVADCICLFALHHLQAFPIDTHISQALERHYKRGFPNRRYQGIQGVMQQYIFYYELFGKEMK